jgi:hypothetical protein
MAADGLRDALDRYHQAQDELVEARNRLARAIAGAAMSGLTQDEIVELTGYTADRVVRICRDAGISEAASAPQRPWPGLSWRRAVDRSSSILCSISRR